MLSEVKQQFALKSENSRKRADSVLNMLKGARVTVLGLGRFGGGVSLVRFLAEAGARVHVSDRAPAETLQSSVEAVAHLAGISFRLGAHSIEDVTNCDILFVNPAIPPHSELVVEARKRGVPIGTEIGLFLHLCPAPVIAVTGTSGKSTTCALTHAVLRAWGEARSLLGGNIGCSLLGEVGTIGAGDLVVLELSSFQLAYLNYDWLNPAGASVACITNLHDDHRNWHGSFDRYAESKRTIFKKAKAVKQSWAVVPGDDGVLLPWARRSGRSIMSVGCLPPGCSRGVVAKAPRAYLVGNESEEALFEFGEVPPGVDLRSAVFAAALSHLAGAPPEAIRTGLSTFAGLPHRFQTVGTIRGVTFIDSSVATTPKEAAHCLRSCTGVVVLLAGGAAEKGLPLYPLIEEAKRRCRSAVFFGHAAPLMAEAFRREAPHLPFKVAETLTDAVRAAYEAATSGDTVLLAPGCPSFDAFVNFAARGRAFQEAVKQLISAEGGSA